MKGSITVKECLDLGVKFAEGDVIRLDDGVGHVGARTILGAINKGAYAGCEVCEFAYRVTATDDIDYPIIVSCDIRPSSNFEWKPDIEELIKMNSEKETTTQEEEQAWQEKEVELDSAKTDELSDDWPKHGDKVMHNFHSWKEGVDKSELCTYLCMSPWDYTHLVSRDLGDDWDVISVPISQLSKPESPQQKEERERLEAIEKMANQCKDERLFSMSLVDDICAKLYDAGYRKQEN